LPTPRIDPFPPLLLRRPLTHSHSPWIGRHIIDPRGSASAQSLSSVRLVAISLLRHGKSFERRPPVRERGGLSRERARQGGLACDRQGNRGAARFTKGRTRAAV